MGLKEVLPFVSEISVDRGGDLRLVISGMLPMASVLRIMLNRFLRYLFPLVFYVRWEVLNRLIVPFLRRMRGLKRAGVACRRIHILDLMILSNPFVIVILFVFCKRSSLPNRRRERTRDLSFVLPCFFSLMIFEIIVVVTCVREIIVRNQNPRRGPPSSSFAF